MSAYGCTLTRQGRALLVRVLAAKLPLTLTRVMVGQGQCPEGTHPADLQDLVEPVAAGTSSEPVTDGDTVRMTVEYRSDLNGGLDHGFWLREFGIFAKAEDGGEILLYYGCLGDYPQYVSAYSSNGGIDVRRFPVSITVGEAAEVVVDYSPEGFLTAEDAKEYCTAVLLPPFLAQAQALIAGHDAAPEAHPAFQGLCAGLDARLGLLELMYATDVSGNPFTVTFGDLGSLAVTGVWNADQRRLEF